MKKIEIRYWVRIGSLVAGGSTWEQARETLYQDLLKKGNLKGAQALREFQDKIHPLPKDDLVPPPLPIQPPSPI